MTERPLSVISVQAQVADDRERRSYLLQEIIEKILPEILRRKY